MSGYLISGISYLIHRNEKLIESANKVTEAYREQSKTLSSNISSLQGQKDEFERLSKGVDNYGNNISLTSDEYDRYKSIVSEILGYSPELIAGYDEEGNAIARKNGLIEKSIELMKLEQKQKLKDITSYDNTKKVFDGAKAEYTNKKNEREKLQFADNVISSKFINSNNNDSYSSSYLTMQHLQAILPKITGKKYDAKTMNFDEYLLNYKDVITKNYDVIREKMSLPSPTNNGTILGINEDDMDSFIQWLRDTYDAIEDLQNQAHDMDDEFMLFAQSSDYYEKLSGEQKNFVNEYIKATGSLVDANGKFLSKDAVWKKANEYTKFVDKLASSPEFEDARKNINSLFSLDKDKLSAKDYEKQVSSILDELQTQFELSADDVKRIKVSLGFEFLSDGSTRTDALIKQVQEKLQDEFDDKVGTLTLEDLQIASQLKVPDETFLTWDELIQKIYEAKQAAEGKFNLTAFNEQVDSLQSAYDTLVKARDEYNQHGAYSLDTLQSLLSLEPQYLAMLVDENGQLSINEASMRSLIEAQLEESKSKIYANGINELNALTSAKTGEASKQAGKDKAGAVTDINAETKALGLNTTAKMLNAAADDALKAGVSDEEVQNIINKTTEQANAIQSAIDGLNIDFSGVTSGFDSKSGSSSSKDDPSKSLKDYTNSVEDNAKKLADAKEKYQDTINDIYKNLDELDKEQHLANLNHQIELSNQELERFGDMLSMLDTKLDMTFDSDYVSRLQSIGTQFKVASEYSSDLRVQLNELLNTTPQNADEAEALADQLESLGNKFYDNQRAIIEYRQAATEARASLMDEMAEMSSEMSKQLADRVERTFNVMENGSITGGLFSTPLIPSVTLDAVKKQRKENDKLIAEEQRYREEIAKVRRTALEMSKQEEDAEREEKRAEYYQEIADAKQELIDSVSDIEESLNESFDSYGNKVDGAVDKTKQGIDDIVNYAQSKELSVSVKSYVENVTGESIDHKASGGTVSGAAIVNEQGLESVILPDNTFRLLKNGEKMLANFPKGSRILNAKDTAEVLRTGLRDGDKIPGYKDGSVSLIDNKVYSSNKSSNVNDVLSEVQSAFDKLADNISMKDVKDKVKLDLNDKKWASDITKTLGDNLKQYEGNTEDSLSALIMQNSSWDDLPDEVQTLLTDNLSVTRDNWEEWIEQPENAVSAMELCRGNSVGSWDLLSPTVLAILNDMGINSKEAWSLFVQNNPLEALVLLVSSWDALKQQIQQYVNDMITIATNGANAISAIVINAPSISQASWDNLQTVIANKIQEVLTAIDETFRENNVDLNFNINTQLGGNAFTNPQGMPVNANNSGVVNSARQYLGVPYVWGGSTPSGFDCSGLTQYVMAQNGKTIPRTADEQFRNGTGIAESNLQPGDLVFYGYGNYADHVGIYAGNDTMIHAPHTGDVVKEVSFSSYWRSGYLGARRYASGVHGATAGMAMVGDEYLITGAQSPTPELIFTTTGRAYLAGLSGAETVYLNSGDTVVPYSETMDILKRNNGCAVGKCNFNSYAKGTGNLTSGQGVTIDVPKGLGKSYAYETWNREEHGYSPWVYNQKKLIELAKSRNDYHFDNEGFGYIGNRYGVAMTSTFGSIGDYVDIYMENGRILHGIIADEKDQTWAHGQPANVWGHSDGQVIVEFLTNWAANPVHANPPGDGGVVKVVNLGNYFGNPTFAGVGINNIYAEIIKKLQSIVGTVSTNTNTGNSKFKGYTALSGRQSKYGFDTPFTSLQRRALGGAVDPDIPVIASELGEEAVLHSDGSIESLGKTPRLWKLRKGDQVFNAKDTAYLKKYLGSDFSHQRLQKFASGTVTVDDSDKKDVSEFIKTINEKIGEEVLKADDTKYNADELEKLSDVCKSLDEDEKITADMLDSLLDTANVLDGIDDWLENEYEDLLQDIESNTQKAFYGIEHEFKNWQKDNNQSFKELIANTDEYDPYDKYFDFMHNTYVKTAQAGIEQAKESLNYTYKSVQELKKLRDTAYEAYRNASTATEQRRIAETISTIQDKLDEAQETWDSTWENIQAANVHTMELRDGRYTNALGYYEAYYNELTRKYEKADDNAKKALQSTLSDALDNWKAIAQGRMDNAHQAAVDSFNEKMEDPMWAKLFETIKTEELFDANGDFNSLYEETINQLQELQLEYENRDGNIVQILGSEIVPAFKDYMATLQVNKKAFLEGQETLNDIDDKVNDLTKSFNDNLIDTFLKIQEKTKAVLEFRLEKSELQYDAKSALYDFQKELRENRLEAEVELKANKELEQWLDPETRKLLFNDDDYSEYVNGINKINSEISKGYRQYREQIDSLKPEEMYRQEEITKQWEQQLAIKKEELQTLKDEMNIAKKTLEYNNAAKEKDTQIIMGNRVVNVADPDTLHQLAQEKAQLENEAELNKLEMSNNADLRRDELINSATQSEINAYQSRIDMINDMTDKEREAFAKALPSQEAMDAFLAALSGTSVRFLNDSMDAFMSDIKGFSRTELGDIYDVGIDYSDNIGVVKSEKLNDILKYNRQEKATHSQGYEQWSDNTHTANYGHIGENLLGNEMSDAQLRLNYMEKYGDDYKQAMDDIVNGINSKGGIFTDSDYRKLAILEGLRNNKIVLNGLNEPITHDYDAYASGIVSLDGLMGNIKLPENVQLANGVTQAEIQKRLSAFDLGSLKGNTSYQFGDIIITEPVKNADQMVREFTIKVQNMAELTKNMSH